MVVPVCEVVDVVTSDWVYTVVHRALVRPLPCASEVCFQSWSSGVQVTHYICVVCPAFSEHVFKSGWKLFEWGSFSHRVHRFRKQSECLELFMSDVSTKYSLDNVGSIKTIHAIGPECSSLLSKNLDWFWRVKAARSRRNFSSKVPVPLQLFLHDIYKLWQVFPLHLFAFPVEVKPDIVKSGVFQLGVHLCKLVSNHFLGSFLIDQVYKILGAVHLFGFYKMLFSCDFRIVEIGLDFDWRRPFQIWLHAPDQRNWTSDLYVWSNFHRSLIKMLHKYMFSLHIVSCISLGVQASRNESPTWSSAILSRDKTKVCLASNFKLRWAYIDISPYARNSKRCILYARKFTE